MASTIKVDNVQNHPGNNLINRCSATTTVGSGAGNTINVDGATVTLGRCGGTVALASGATQTGFGRTGTVDWQTGSIKTGTFTAANGEGYFADTSSGAFTMNLPAGTAGHIVAVADYTRTFGTNILTVSPNGSEKIGGIAEDAELDTDGQSATFVYVDSTEGWINIQETSTSVAGLPPYIAACGGNTTLTSGDYKTHIFTSPGTFTVTAEGSPTGSNGVEYMVVGGGVGGGSGCAGGGAGAGGMRVRSVCSPTTPLNAPAPLQVSVQGYAITVGAGGAGSTSPNSGSSSAIGANGNSSIFSSITSAGGGGGAAGSGSSPDGNNGAAGGSGGGGGHSGGCGGAGNTPPVSPNQGFPGGQSVPSGDDKSGGGGGAAAASDPTVGPSDGGAGSYIPTTFLGPTAPSYGETGPQGRFFAGGAGGSRRSPSATPQGAGGLGGGADGCLNTNGNAGSTNMGGGGSGGSKPASSNSGGDGGSGIVMIRYKFQ